MFGCIVGGVVWGFMFGRRYGCVSSVRVFLKVMCRLSCYVIFVSVMGFVCYFGRDRFEKCLIFDLVLWVVVYGV